MTLVKDILNVMLVGTVGNGFKIIWKKKKKRLKINARKINSEVKKKQTHSKTLGKIDKMRQT